MCPATPVSPKTLDSKNRMWPRLPEKHCLFERPFRGETSTVWPLADRLSLGGPAWP